MPPEKPENANAKGKAQNGGNLGFEAELFLAADKLRKNLEPSDYKHVVLGLIFLRHISGAFEAKREALLAQDPESAEDQDEYLAENVFWVPKEARWTYLQANAKQPTIGKLIDDAMLAIESSNASLKSVRIFRHIFGDLKRTRYGAHFLILLFPPAGSKERRIAGTRI